jgi:hypothetical protein
LCCHDYDLVLSDGINKERYRGGRSAAAAFDSLTVKRVTLAGDLFETGTVDNRDLAAAIANEDRPVQLPGRLADPERRTPSIAAMTSCVRGKTSAPSRSLAINSQRALRCSIEWSRLQPAVCELRLSKSSMKRSSLK